MCFICRFFQVCIWALKCVLSECVFLLQILPGLYVGNFNDAKDLEKLNANNVTHILSIHENAKKHLNVSRISVSV